MAALERDLQRVLPDQRDVLHAQLLRVETLDTSEAARLVLTDCGTAGDGILLLTYRAR